MVGIIEEIHVTSGNRGNAILTVIPGKNLVNSLYEGRKYHQGFCPHLFSSGSPGKGWYRSSGL
jgi:hypothetical protein